MKTAESIYRVQTTPSRHQQKFVENTQCTLCTANQWCGLQLSRLQLRPSAIMYVKIFAVFVKNSNYRLFIRSHANFGEDRTIHSRVIAYFWFPKWRPSAILDSHIFTIFVKNANLRLFLRPQAKFGDVLTIRGRAIAYFRFSKWRLSAILIGMTS